MKFNPYAALLLTSASMLLTVAVSQMGSGAALLRAGAASMDRDVASLAARTWVSLEGHTSVAGRADTSPTRLASIDKPPQERTSHN